MAQSTHPILGTLIDNRYLVETLLGDGKTASVYRVRDTQLDNQSVALKLFHPHLLEGDAERNRLRDAILRVRQISHPNIIRIYDVVLRAGAKQYITMELIEGSSLHTLNERIARRYTTNEVAALIVQILSAFAEAHRNGIAHGNINPKNILLTYSGIVKCGDFNMSNFQDARTLTQTGSFLGAPGYLAPEQFLGEAPSTRSDVYSLGIILFELCCSTLPFLQKSLFPLAQAHAEQAIPLEKIPEEFREKFQPLIETSLSKKPESRFADAGALEQSLAPSIKQFDQEELSETVLNYSFDSRGSRSSRPRTFMVHFMLFLLVSATFPFILNVPIISERTSSDILRLERFYRRPLPALRTIFRVPEISLLNHSSLEKAARRGDERAIRTWCLTDVRTLGFNQSGESVLHTFMKYPEMNKYIEGCLLPHMYDTPNPEGERPIITAVRSGNTQLVRNLLRVGFTANTSDQNGSSALKLAVDSENPSLVQAFSVRRSRGVLLRPDEALMGHVVQTGDLAMVKVLRSMHIDINQRDEDGYTPLMHAARLPEGSCEPMIAYLLAHGAHCKARSDASSTAYDICNAQSKGCHCAPLKACLGSQ